MRYLRHLSSCICLLFFTSCAIFPSSTPTKPNNNGQGSYKVGQPYQIAGTWYYPHEDYSYDETGIASWYGGDFHDHATANGEIYNKNELTAAHKTLPLPTLARVTNLDNGRSIVVRINDRGPFSGARIIDVSQRAAQLLGFEQTGTAKVRVQVLADESKAIADAMRHYGAAAPIVVASAEDNKDNNLPPPVTNAPLTSVSSQPLEDDPTVKNLKPIETTPAIHQQLIDTKPVAAYVEVPVGSTHHIYVQAGAFTVLENATKLQQSLSHLGTTSVSDAVINGTKFYRVRVGPLSDVTHADAMLKTIKQSGITTARTIVD